MIYLVVFILCVVLLFMEQTKGFDKISFWMKWGAFIFFVLFIGLRYRIGPDYFSYQEIYQDISIREDLELFFYGVIAVFNSFKLDFIYFLLFIAVLSIGIKFYTFNKYSPYFFLSLMIALPISLLGDMGQIRFSLAIAVLWLSIPYCLERNLIKFLLVVLAACIMHNSAIVFVIVYWVTDWKINIYIMLGLWLLCYLISYSAFTDIFSSPTSDFGVNDLTEKSEQYMDAEDFSGRYTISIFNILTKLLVLALVYFLSDYRKNTGLYRLLLNIYFIGGCFFFLFSFNQTFGNRFSLYFLSFEAIAIPGVIYTIKDIKLHYLLIPVFIIKAFYQYYTLIYISYPEMYFPYRNVLKPI